MWLCTFSCYCGLLFMMDFFKCCFSLEKKLQRATLEKYSVLEMLRSSLSIFLIIVFINY
jgi:hypothetical protein